jgi:hypothetical protein
MHWKTTIALWRLWRAMRAIGAGRYLTAWRLCFQNHIHLFAMYDTERQGSEASHSYIMGSRLVASWFMSSGISQWLSKLVNNVNEGKQRYHQWYNKKESRGFFAQRGCDTKTRRIHVSRAAVARQRRKTRYSAFKEAHFDMHNYVKRELNHQDTVW